MAGVPGCGKSAIAKAIANEWGMNLLTVEATNLKGSLVGESEAKTKRLFDTAKAAAPVIVFVDEAEKLLGKSEGTNDGGAHDAVLGQFLSFMQEDDSGVFFMFTANNMEKFSPELVDRFEGRYFIDLPSAGEREEIIKIHLSLRKQNVENFDLSALVRATKDFSGRNIEQSINEAMTISFDDGARPLTSDDLLLTFKTVIPTSKTKKTEIETMRTFVENGMMRGANDAGTANKPSASAGSKLKSFN
jgi:SpoVK/Ycf46/Vps4 family AAA+-type ATPase